MRSSREQPGSYVHFLEIQHGKGKIHEPKISLIGNILATCNGLILATIKQKRGLLVMNPITGKFSIFPLGTIVASGNESYGLVFSHHTSKYKVVHLFQDKLKYIGCEILSLTTRSWWAVDGPSFGLFEEFAHRPVSARGALHWLPDQYGCDYLVSMGIDDEKFCTTDLPISSAVNDRLVEIGGVLSFVTHVTQHLIKVWILKGEDWIKQYSFNLGYKLTHLIPIFMSRNGREMVFKGDGYSLFFAYDFVAGVLKKVELETEDLEHCFFPHVNSLAFWNSPRAL